MKKWEIEHTEVCWSENCTMYTQITGKELIKHDEYTVFVDGVKIELSGKIDDIEVIAEIL